MPVDTVISKVLVEGHCMANESVKMSSYGGVTTIHICSMIRQKAGFDLETARHLIRARAEAQAGMHDRSNTLRPDYSDFAPSSSYITFVQLRD